MSYDVTVTSWSCRGARAKGMMHDDVMHMSEVEPEHVIGSGAGRAKGKGLDRVLGMWLLVEPTGDIT